MLIQAIGRLDVHQLGPELRADEWLEKPEHRLYPKRGIHHEKLLQVLFVPSGGVNMCGEARQKQKTKKKKQTCILSVK
jgi:hypothetical protein